MTMGWLCLCCVVLTEHKNECRVGDGEMERWRNGEMEESE